jgi:hypothetical protein
MDEQQAQVTAVKVPLFSAARERTGEFEVSAAVGDRGNQDAWPDFGRRPQAMASEGDRACAGRLHPFASLASRRDNIRAAAARLFL